MNALMGCQIPPSMRLVDIPSGVKKWKLVVRPDEVVRVYLFYEDRTETRWVEKTGANEMKPSEIMLVAMNRRRQPPDYLVAWDEVPV